MGKGSACGSRVPAQASSASQTSTILLSGCLRGHRSNSNVTLGELSPVPPSGSTGFHWLGVSPRMSVCGRLSVIALPACPAPGTTLLAACVVPWARAPGSSNRLLECPFAALRTRWPSPTWEPTFCAKLQEPRMSVTWTPTGPLAGFVFFSLRVWGKESPTGWEGELLAFSLSLAICCLLRQACLERVCIKWMQAAIP